jgi:hypothetical protein
MKKTAPKEREWRKKRGEAKNKGRNYSQETPIEHPLPRQI